MSTPRGRDLSSVGEIVQPDQSTAGGAKTEERQQVIIDVGVRDLNRLTRQAWQALADANNPPRLFVRGGSCVRIESRPDGAVVVAELTRDRMQHALVHHVSFVRTRKGEQVPEFPPRELLANMLATDNPPLPLLKAVTGVPCLVGDGTLVSEPGFHAPSGVFYAPAAGLVVRTSLDAPIADELEIARELILEDLLVDFPFVSEADKAHTVAALLHPIIRPMIAGPTPLHLIEKPAPGSGGSLLAEAIGLVVTGLPAVVMTEGRDEEEWRKRITAKLCEGPSIVVIDNIRRPLDSASLASVLTAPIWGDRMLGQTANVQIPVMCLWMATGNNVRLSNEIARRAVRIRIDTSEERPWLREGFKHKPLLGWAGLHRSNIIEALLTFVRAWLVAGRPYYGRQLGSYEAWSNIVGGVLEVAGIPGFLGNIDALYDQADGEGKGWKRFVVSWWERFGEAETSAKELYPVASELDPPFERLGKGSEHAQRTALGRALGAGRDRVFEIDGVGRIRITPLGERQGAMIWALRVVTP